MKSGDREAVTLPQMISLIRAYVFYGPPETQLVSMLVWSVVVTGSAVHLTRLKFR